MRHIAKITGVKRSHDGELVVDADIRAGGFIHNLPNTVDNFTMDEEILLLAIRRSDADQLHDWLSTAAEAVEKEYSVDSDKLWRFVEALKPDELPETAQAATV